MHLTRLLFCALLLLAAPFAPAQAPALPYKAHAVTTPDGVKLNVQEWDNPAGPIAGGMIAEDLQKNVDSTRAFLRACFSKQCMRLRRQFHPLEGERPQSANTTEKRT